MLKHLRFDIFELEETKLPVRLINTTNEWRVVQGYEIPLRLKGDIEDVSSPVNRTQWGLKVVMPSLGLGFGWNARNSSALAELAPNKTNSRFMISIKYAKRENNSKCPEILEK
ncbi:UNVERIFIED_CONTAM: hypothetical protein NCL1_38567 [Trichonephila clavipes]